jgi:DNA-binding NtrC family response regulator
MTRRILVVDSDDSAAAQISKLIGKPDRPVKVAPDGTSALECLIEGNFSLVLLDTRLADIPALELIREVSNRRLAVSIILLLRDGEPAPELSQSALGVYESLRKPVDPARLSILVDRALNDRALRDEVESLRRRILERAQPALVARGEAMIAVMAQAEEASNQSSPVLIWGEEGTGKEALARFIHESSPGRRRAPMVVLPCRALPESIFDGLLANDRSDHRGASMPTRSSFAGLADGTLVLSDVQDLALGFQTRLAASLARLRNRQGPLQGPRLIALSRVDPAAAVEVGAFRRDLLAELDGTRIALPPLRARSPENFPLLIGTILERLRSYGLPDKTISPRALISLERHDWPGNVGELERLVERLVVTTPGPVIGLENLPEELLESKVDPLLLTFDSERPLGEIVNEMTDRLEEAYLRGVLAQNHGRIDHTAEQSGLSRRSVSDKLKRLGIDKNEYRGA